MRGLQPVVEQARDIFRQLLDRHGPHDLRRLRWYPDRRSLAVVFEATFVGRPDPFCWRVDDRVLAMRVPPAREIDELCRGSLRDAYYQALEDHLVERELRGLRDRFHAAVASNAHHISTLDFMRRELAVREEHIRRHHRRDPVHFVDYGREVTTATVTMQDAPADPAQIMYAMESLREQIDRELRLAFNPGHNPFRDDGDSPEQRRAEARGLKLLKRWLAPEQAASYERDKHFEVRGSHSGKRYRINHGRQMNIDELDADGRKVQGWCFLPQGGLVAPDCMLAQKIALETDEAAALKVANKVGGALVPNGAIFDDAYSRIAASRFLGVAVT